MPLPAGFRTSCRGGFRWMPRGSGERLVGEFDQDGMVRAQERLYAGLPSRERGFRDGHDGGSGVPLWGVHRQFPERGDPSLAAGGVDRVAPIALPRLRQADPGVGEYPYRELHRARREMRRMRWCNLLEGPGSRVLHGGRVRRDLSSGRDRDFAPARSAFLLTPRADCLHRHRPPDHPRRTIPRGSSRDCSFPFSPAVSGKAVSRGAAALEAASSTQRPFCMKKCGRPKGWAAGT